MGRAGSGWRRPGIEGDSRLPRLPDSHAWTLLTVVMVAEGRRKPSRPATGSPAGTPRCPASLDAIGAEPAVGVLDDEDAVDDDRRSAQGVPRRAGARGQLARVQPEPV